MKTVILLSVFCLALHFSGSAQRTVHKVFTAKDVDALPANVLYVINDSIAGTSKDVLKQIKPADIKKIKTVTDPGATAVYGTRGAKGVVLLTVANRKKVAR